MAALFVLLLLTMAGILDARRVHAIPDARPIRASSW
jgi:hypothetical protein